ncbi:cobalt-precorrin 5A hydrolase [Pseudorhizobium tarimense]|uniref:Cobalt-precorrin 5A hydrolase n=1 Tax=Pseudorhizobium tarimense TaxID=1079109 RepID=A0ABV2H4T0_9HYPH|nr:cobalamin biosynthesis protein [Pseudorhizobium tarimense]MCJ8518766.1 cobalamin biosynthesis protein [Pseudorhizobium tarimense]
MIVAGLGCRKGTSADGLAAALRQACEQAGLDLSAIDALATGIIKEFEPGMIDLRDRLAVPLRIIDDEALKAVEGLTQTVSRHSLAQTSSPSLSEAAALAAAGADAQLIVARVVAEGATCALAQSEEVR